MTPAAALLDAVEAALRAGLAWASAGPWRRSAVLALLALAILLPGTASLPVTDRDEARFAQASKQMLETGELIDIRFQDKPRWKKPAGIYWLQAGAASAMGGAEAPIAAYRLPSLVGAILAAVLLAWAVAPLAGAQAATLAGAMLAGTLLTAAEANIAKTDAALLATGVAMLGAMVRMMPDIARPPLGVAMALWAGLGVSILLKGPIVPAICLLAAAALWLAQRRAPRLGRLRPLPGLLVTLALVAPWLAAIWVISDGAFFAESLGRDLMGKVAEGQEKHWGPPGLYLVLVWLTLWPFAPLIVAAAPWIRAGWRSPAVLLAAAWVVPFWVVLEAVPTKLPHYVLPLYPALLMLLAAWALSPDRPAPSARLSRANALLLLIPGGGLILASIGLPLALEGRVAPQSLSLGLIAVACLALAAIAARRDRPLAQIGLSIPAAAALYASVLGHGLPALETVFPSPRAATLAERWRACASGPMISAGYREPSLVFLTETGTNLATPRETLKALETDPGALVLLEDRWRSLIERQTGRTIPPVVERGRITYFNYNRGSVETARLVTPDDPRWAACGG